MPLLDPARAKVEKMFKAMANAHGKDNVSTEFTVVQRIAQTMQLDVTNANDFLSLINLWGVVDLDGDKVLVGVTPGMGKRTDLSGDGERKPTKNLVLGDKTYHLTKSEYDTAIGFGTINAWASFPQLAPMWSTQCNKSEASAIILSAWYGETEEEFTNPVAYPNGEDLKIGFFQRLRDYKEGSQILLQGSTANEIRIGAGGDFANLDTAAYACKQLLHKRYRKRKDLVVLVGSALVAQNDVALYEANTVSSEKPGIEKKAVKETFGGMQMMTPDEFPEGGLMVTTLDNMSRYYQITSIRRKTIEKEAKECFQNFNTVYDGFFFENEEMAAAFEWKNVMVEDGAGGWVSANE